MEIRIIMVVEKLWNISHSAVGQLFTSVYEIKSSKEAHQASSIKARLFLPKAENSEDHLALMSKIMEAISIELKDCDLVFYTDTKDALERTKAHDVKLRLIFGLQPEQGSDKYQLLEESESSLIWCDALTDIAQSTDLKRALWSTLKHISV